MSISKNIETIMNISKNIEIKRNISKNIETIMNISKNIETIMNMNLKNNLGALILMAIKGEHIFGEIPHIP